MEQKENRRLAPFGRDDRRVLAKGYSDAGASYALMHGMLELLENEESVPAVMPVLFRFRMCLRKQK